MQRNAWPLWLLATTYAVFSVFSVVAFAVLTPSIEAGTGFSTARVAAIASVYFIVFAFAQLAAGVLIDRLGARVVLAASALLAAIGGGLFVVSTSFVVLGIARGLMGLGLSAAFVGAIYIARVAFPAQRFAFMSGLTQFAVNIGGAVASIAVAGLAYGPVILTMAVVNVAIVVIILLFMRTGPRPSERQDFGPALRSSNVWLAALFFAGTFGTLVALADFWAVPMLDRHGHRLSTIGVLVAMLPLGTALGALLVGTYATRRGGIVLQCRVSAVVSTALVVLFVALGPTSAPVAGVLLFCIGFAQGGAILGFVVADRGCPDSTKGTAIGLLNTIGYAGAGVATFVVAALDWFDHSWKFAPIIALSAMAIVGSFLMREREDQRPK